MKKKTSKSLTVLVPSPNRTGKTRIGTGYIRSNGKNAKQSFVIECDKDDLSETLWSEKSDDFQIISDVKFHKETGPVRVFVEDKDSNSRHGLTLVGKGYYLAKKIEIQCDPDPTKKALWNQNRHKLIILPEKN